MQVNIKDNLVCFLRTNKSFDLTHNLDIWHCRLGHPSNRVSYCLAKGYYDVQYDRANVCTPFHLATQQKLPLPLSKTSS